MNQAKCKTCMFGVESCTPTRGGEEATTTVPTQDTNTTHTFVAEWADAALVRVLAGAQTELIGRKGGVQLRGGGSRCASCPGTGCAARAMRTDAIKADVIQGDHERKRKPQGCSQGVGIQDTKGRAAQGATKSRFALREI